MFSTSLQAPIKALPLAQFLALLDELQIDRGGLFDRASPDERLIYLENQAAAAPMAEAAISQALNRVLGVGSSDEATLRLVRDRIADAIAQLGLTDAVASAQPLARQVIEQIDSIRAAKKIHDTIQHQLAYKLAEFARVGLQLTEKPASRSGASRVVRIVTEDIQKTTQDAKSLKATERARMESASTRILKPLKQLTSNLNPDTPVDDSTGAFMTTVLDMELRPYVAQIPSQMQQHLVDQSASIPWGALGTVVSTGAVAPNAGQSSFTALQSLFDELIHEHGSWQTMNNEIARISERLDLLFPTPERALANEMKFLSRSICDLAGTVPLSATCLPLALKFRGALKLEKTEPPEIADENDVRSRLEALEGFIAESFHNSDDKLLTACGELESISQSLQRFLLS